MVILGLSDLDAAPDAVLISVLACEQPACLCGTPGWHVMMERSRHVHKEHFSLWVGVGNSPI